MKKIDYKVVGVAIFLLVISIYSYTNWNSVAKFLMTFLESKILTFGIWILLVITSVIHYNKNYDENIISDKEDLERVVTTAVPTTTQTKATVNTGFVLKDNLPIIIGGVALIGGIIYLKKNGKI
ncbi:hypothetical protein F7649_10635 [Tenacibaculum piscium]|uniref:hypothetical protein n=1 Tax=Tenacibaculum piscium TaxID=1458515 RepID=UPI00187B36F2|nr:hypothetical protein [Tenacibaculum piscium]MBE7671568.1 hypothetical protein [Tenacibaculum piscium]